MKGFFSLFTESAKKLHDTRTLTTTGILLAMALVLRKCSISITPDIRIAFSFIPICVIGMLYGPAVSGMAGLCIDVIGFILDTQTIRGYSPQLSVLSVVIGMVYGIILFKGDDLRFTKLDFVRIVAARLFVVAVLNVCVRSYLMYTLYVNPSFSLIGSDSSMRSAFMLYIQPRAFKALAEFPIDIAILFVIIPTALKAYGGLHRSVRKGQ